MSYSALCTINNPTGASFYLSNPAGALTPTQDNQQIDQGGNGGTSYMGHANETSHIAHNAADLFKGLTSSVDQFVPSSLLSEGTAANLGEGFGLGSFAIANDNFPAGSLAANDNFPVATSGSTPITVNSLTAGHDFPAGSLAANDNFPAGEGLPAANDGLTEAEEGLEPLAKIAGGLSVATAPFLADKGYHELQDGNNLDGSADMTQAVANGVGGLGLVAGATGVGPVGLGVGALADGTRGIIHGVQNGNNEEIGVGSAKDLGGSLMIAGGTMALTGFGAAPGAIVAGVGGAITGGAYIYEHRDQIGHAIQYGANQVGSAIQSGFEAAVQDGGIGYAGM